MEEDKKEEMSEEDKKKKLKAEEEKKNKEAEQEKKLNIYVESIMPLECNKEQAEQEAVLEHLRQRRRERRKAKRVRKKEMKQEQKARMREEEKERWEVKEARQQRKQHRKVEAQAKREQIKNQHTSPKAQETQTINKAEIVNDPRVMYRSFHHKMYVKAEQKATLLHWMQLAKQLRNEVVIAVETGVMPCRLRDLRRYAVHNDCVLAAMNPELLKLPYVVRDHVVMSFITDRRTAWKNYRRMRALNPSKPVSKPCMHLKEQSDPMVITLPTSRFRPSSGEVYSLGPIRFSEPDELRRPLLCNALIHLSENGSLFLIRREPYLPEVCVTPVPFLQSFKSSAASSIQPVSSSAAVGASLSQGRSAGIRRKRRVTIITIIITIIITTPICGRL